MKRLIYLLFLLILNNCIQKNELIEKVTSLPVQSQAQMITSSPIISQLPTIIPASIQVTPVSQLISVSPTPQITPVPENNLKINTSLQGNQREPSIAMNSEGNYVITWQSSDTGMNGKDIYARRYDKNGKALTSEFKVNTSSLGEQILPKAAMAEDGSFVIVWASKRQNYEVVIYAQRYDINGKTLGSEFQVNTTKANYSPEIAMNKSGAFIILWNIPLLLQKYDKDGNKVGEEFNVDNSIISLRGYSIGIDNNENFIITLKGPESIIARKYTKDLSIKPEEKIIDGDTSDSWVDNPKVSMNDKGYSAITWSSSFAMSMTSRVNYIKFKELSDIQRLGGSRPVYNDINGIMPRKPDVALNDNETFVIVGNSWSVEAGHLSDKAIFVRLFGYEIVESRLFNFDTNNTPRYPRVAIDGNGNFVVTWDGYDNGDFDIYAKRFDKNGNAI